MKEASEIIKARKEEKLSKMTPSFRLEFFLPGIGVKVRSLLSIEHEYLKMFI